MSRFIGALLALFVAGASGVAAADSFNAVVDSYLQIQQQLAADKTEGVGAAAAEIVKQATAMGEAGAPIAAAAKKVQDSSDLKGARDAFGALSTAVIDTAKAKGWTNLPDVKLAYCPMADKSWLQKSEKIENPYYGSQMLTCGSFVDKKK